MTNLLGKNVKEGTRWRHHNGCEYTVKCLANVTSTRPEYPVTVIYEGDNGLTWTKTLEDFLAKMTPIDEISKKCRALGLSKDFFEGTAGNQIAEKGSRIGLSSSFEKDMVEFVEHFDDSSYGALNANTQGDIKLNPTQLLSSRMLSVSLHRYDPYGFVELYLLKTMQTITESWRDYVTLGQKSRVMVIAPEEFDSLKSEITGSFPLTYMAKIDWFTYTEVESPAHVLELSAKIRATLTDSNKEYALVVMVGLADRFANTLLGYLSSDLVEFTKASDGSTFILNVARGYRA